MKETHTVVRSTSALELYCTDCQYTLFLLKDVLVNVLVYLNSRKLEAICNCQYLKVEPSHNMISCLIIMDIYMSGSHIKICFLASNVR